MTNFAQPVSMEWVTEDQKKFLIEELGKLGYFWNNCNSYQYKFLTTNFGGKTNHVGQIREKFAVDNGQYFIPSYNPELFLAIAGMREGEDVHVGEWMIATRDSSDILFGKFTKGFLKQKEKQSQFEGKAEDMPSWRKATLSELITHFTKKDMPKEQEFKFGDKVRFREEKDGAMHTGIFVAKGGGNYPFIVTISQAKFDSYSLNGNDAYLISAIYCEHVPEPMVLTSKMIKEAFKCDSYVIQD